MEIAAMTSLFYGQRNTAAKTPALESIRRLKKIGFSHIDLNLCGMARNENEFCRDDWREKTFELKEEAQRLGVTFVQCHSPYFVRKNAALVPCDDYDAYFKGMLARSLDIAHILSIPFAVVHPALVEDADAKQYDVQVKATVELHREFLEKAAALGIRPAFENCGFCRDGEDLNMLCDRLARYNAGVCWDIGHGNLKKTDQCADIASLKGRILCVHTHDNSGKNDDHLMPFFGNIAWEKVLPALRKAEFKNDLVLEVAQNKNLPEELRDPSTVLCAQASRILIDLFNREDGGTD